MEMVTLIHCVQLMTAEESSRIFTFAASRWATVFSQRFWTVLSRFCVLTDSIATRLSTIVAFFSELARFVVSESSRICFCTMTASASTSRPPISIGMASGQAMTAMTMMKNIEKGRST